jgi:hypothetical protein
MAAAASAAAGLAAAVGAPAQLVVELLEGMWGLMTGL